MPLSWSRLGEMDMNFFSISKCQKSHHIETSQLICCAKQLTGFYMNGTLVVKRLKLVGTI